MTAVSLRDRVGRQAATRAGATVGAWRLAWSASPSEMAAGVALAVVASCAPAAVVACSKWLVDLAVGNADRAAIVRAAVLLGVLAGAQTWLRAVQNNQLVMAARRVGHVVHRRFLQKAATIELAAFDDQAWHDRYSRVASSAVTRPGPLTQAVVGIVGSSVALVSLAGVIAAMHPMLVALAAIGEVPALILNRRIGERLYRNQVETSSTEREKTYTAQLLADPRAAKDVRAYGLAPILLGRFDNAEGELSTRMAAVLTSIARGALLAAAWSGATLAIAYGIVGVLARSGALTPGALVAVLTGVALVATNVSGLVNNVRRLDEEATLFLRDLNDFLDEPSPVPTPDHPTALPPGGLPIHFDGVSFTYPSGGTPALENVSFSVEPGELLAIVGDNGAGRTTLIKLLLRFYLPDAGAIRVGGVDTRDLDPETLRSRIGVLFQDFLPFEFTVTDNVSIGRAEVPPDNDRVDAALARAQAHAFVAQLPDQTDTVVGRNLGAGHDLSGGQWQRLALARLFYRDADIWVLDEPTSALDPEAEAAIFAELRHALGTRTGIVISHRFSTVRMADHIIVMEDGRITEAGTHDELVQLDGRYQHLYELQAQGYR